LKTLNLLFTGSCLETLQSLLWQMETKDNVLAIHAKKRRDWRKWLEKNHETEKAVWLIMYNKTSTTESINYEEAVEEALCFGWIDSKAVKRDDESRYQYFAKRKPKSNWSKPNKLRVEKMTSQGLMTASGQKLIDLAKATGTWDALNDADNNVIPADLQALLNDNDIARKNFEAFSTSSKRIILEWIQAAKRPETREKRIKETVELAEKNIRAHFPLNEKK
jgi:uncharacterized protein YdeI (YjbR/CyaY-like superfamily)